MNQILQDLHIDFLNSKTMDWSAVLKILQKGSIQLDGNLLDKVYSGEWILNNQEIAWLESHPENEWASYLEFRFQFRFRNVRENILQFPIYLVVEPASLCNLKCKMCFQTDKRLSGGGVMSLSLFKKVIDEASNKGCGAITIAGRGEPLVNKDIVDMLQYLKGKFFEIKLNTNGLLLTETIARAILDAEINEVVFSAEGNNSESYEKIRIGGNFEKLIANIKMFNNIKETKYMSSLTKTRVCGVAMDEFDRAGYLDFWKEKVDDVAITEYEERSNTYDNCLSYVGQPCDRLWQRLYILWDGKVSPCDIDYLSQLNMENISDKSISEVWNGKRLAELREGHLTGARGNIHPCNRCYYG